MPQLPTQNSRYNVLKICFPHGQEQGVEETMIFDFKNYDFKNFSLELRLRYSDTYGVALAEEQSYITWLTQGAINQKQINIRIIKLTCIRAPRSWSNVNNTVASTLNVYI